MKIEPLNERHRTDIGIALGLAASRNILNSGLEKYGKLPGYNTAIACIKAIEAEHRAQVTGSNIRAAAKAGVDINTHFVGMRGRGEIFTEPMDLVGQADFEAGRPTRMGGQNNGTG